LTKRLPKKIKIEHASAVSGGESSGVSLEYNGEILSFSTSDIDEIVEARLEEIFEAINKELTRAGRAGKLPSGVVLTGGSAKLKGFPNMPKNH
jgi:cell division protein FtsA